MKIEEYIFNGDFHEYLILRTIFIEINGEKKGGTVLIQHSAYSFYAPVKEKKLAEYTTESDAVIGHEKHLKTIRTELGI